MSSKIQEYFQNKSIFITGGTGFVGKVLIEKLLRVCNVKKIYMLTRPKKGLTSEERISALFDYPCFSRLEKNDIGSKLVLIHGDCNKPHLGISEADQNILKSNVEVVIHAAANVRFDQSLTEATYMLRCMDDLISLAEDMIKLEAFVFVSTAYSNCTQAVITEKFYEPPIIAEDLISLINSGESPQLRTQLLGDWPNTYVFAKAVIEDLVRRKAKNLPIAIVRPAIVVNTAEEPMPGWLDNFYGVVGVVSGGGLGLLHSFRAKGDANAWIVPCDFVVNTVLAVTWKTHHDNAQAVKIYNFIGSNKNPISNKRFMDVAYKYLWIYPPSKSVWYCTLQMRENKLYNEFCRFIMHTLVAHVVDFVFLLLGKKRFVVKQYNKLHKYMDLVSYFSIRNFTFTTTNVDELWSNLNDADKKMFKFDMSDLNWDKMLKQALLGGRTYLLKDPIETIPQAITRLKFFRIAHYVSLSLICLALYKLIICFIGLFL